MELKIKTLERIPDPYRHCHIVIEIIISCEGSPSPSYNSLGVTQLKSEISPEQHEFDIKPQTDPCPHSKVINEGLKFELATTPVLNIPESPDVTYINEGGSFQYPEKLEPVFEVAYKLYICCLINKRTIGKDIRARAECF